MIKTTLGAMLSLSLWSSFAFSQNNRYRPSFDEPTTSSNDQLDEDKPSIPRPEEVHVEFDATQFESKPWLKEFQYVVVVNKDTVGTERQSVRVYLNSRPVQYYDVVTFLNKLQSDDYQLYTQLNSKSWPSSSERQQLEDVIKRMNERDLRTKELSSKMRSDEVFMVSTGRDEFEKKGEHHSNKDAWSVTPTGYYVPQYFAEKHKSETYSNSLCDSFFGKIIGAIRNKDMCTMMENAIFFNEGVALHKAIPGTEDALGEKASGGCVRLPGALAEYLFKNIKAATSESGVPVVDKAGSVQIDSTGQVVKETRHKSVWGEMTARSALIIVKKAN